MRRVGTSEGATQQPGGELCRYYSCVWVVVVVVGVSSTEDRCRKTVPPASKMVVTHHITSNTSAVSYARRQFVHGVQGIQL